MQEIFREGLPFFTVDLPGVGGQIKQFNEDFVVEEIPLYRPSGEGTHAYFAIEKQGLTTLAAIKQVANALGKPSREIGYAGLKDAHGITRQMFSVEHVDPQRVADLSFARIKVLSVSRHTNKLKLGHLAGNRFIIKTRDSAPSATPKAEAVLERLMARGVPNYFGPQRFGARGDNGQIGRAVLCEDYEKAIALILGRLGPFDHGRVRQARELFESGDLHAALSAWPPAFREQIRVCREMVRTGGDARRAWEATDRTLRKLYVSACQSELFNRVVAVRITGLHRLETGDLAYKHANGACFRVEDAAVEQPRCDAFEISPTGPLFGPRMTEPFGRPRDRELNVLADAGLTRGLNQSKHRDSPPGGRRPLRVPIGEPELDAGSDDRGAFLRLRFTLPAGAYATNVTREVCKA